MLTATWKQKVKLLFDSIFIQCVKYFSAQQYEIVEQNVFVACCFKFCRSCLWC